MISFFQISFVIVLLGFTAPVQSIKVNVTRFGNCDFLDPSENLEHFVNFTDIVYEINSDGLCDTVHGKYHIPTVNTGDKLMNITMMRCKEETTTGPCSDNAEHFYEILHCQRFKKDDTGPWFMVSDGMQKTSKCGEEIGHFELKNARLKPEYLTNFMKHDIDHPKHRMVRMTRKYIDGTDDTVIRACLDIEFTIFF